MKYLLRHSFDVHVCFANEHDNRVTAFDIYHRWTLPECRKGVLADDDMCVRMESCQCVDDEGFEMAGFKLHYAAARNSVRFGSGRRAYKFPFIGMGSGGNMYWEVIVFRNNVVPHVLNWLRRQPQFSKTEWRTEFMALWESRRAIDEAAVNAWGKRAIHRELKRQAAEIGCTVGKLIELSKPQ